MKKIMFLAALGFFTLTANAQSKEELKAIKEATKEAEKQVKKAKEGYEMSIPNPQYGRKETDYTKLDAAKALIKEALANKYNELNPAAYSTAVDILNEYYKKYEGQIKAGDESNKEEYINIAADMVKNAIKADSLENINPKKKEVEYKATHIKLQQVSANPLIQCLMAAQNYSNSESQNDLKKGASLATLVIDAFTKSNLMSDFENPEKENWITYSKAFKAQSLQAIEGTDPNAIEAAWVDLIGTKYESTAYSALANYFREKNPNKYMEYLQKGMEKATPETYPNFAFLLMQYQFNNDKKDDCLKTIQDIKAKCPDNENTINAYLMEGQIYFEKKQFDKAEALFAEAVQKFPNDERAITMPAKSAWMKAQTSGDKKDMQHAIDEFKKLESTHPAEPDLWGEPLYILYNNTGNIAARDKYKKYYSVK